MHPQLSSAQLFIAQQRRAVPCSAVRCCFVLRCAFVRTYSSTRFDAKYQVPGAVTYEYVRVVYSSFCFLKLIVISRSPCPPPCKLHPYCRSERDIANKHTASAQHRATSSAQAAALGIINKLVAPNHGPLLSVPFTYVLVAFVLARAKLAASAADRSPFMVYIYPINTLCRDRGLVTCSPLHIRPCLRRTLVSNTGHVLRWGHDTIL